MQHIQLLHNLEFNDSDPYAQPLHVDKDVRILRFMLKPGQSITEHTAPSSPFTAVILKGRAYFTDADGVEKEFGPNTMLLFTQGEAHSVRAGDEEVVFLGFLLGVSSTREDHVGGEMSRD